jgi:hypothetical protein
MIVNLSYGTGLPRFNLPQRTILRLLIVPDPNEHLRSEMTFMGHSIAVTSMTISGLSQITPSVDGEFKNGDFEVSLKDR